MKNYPIVLLFAASFVASASTENGSVLKTPPPVIASLNDQKLNELGLAMANQIHFILSNVGSPKGKLGGSLDQTEKNAVKNVKALLDDKVMIQRSTMNHAITKQTYVPTDVDEYRIDSLNMTRAADNVLVVTYYVSLPNRVDLKSNTVMSGKLIPRITVLRWNDTQLRWLIFSHADFDAPEAMLCGVKPSGLAVEKSQFTEGDISLGKQVINDLVQSKLQGEKPNVYGKGYQIILASGERNIPSKPIASLNVKVGPTNLEAIRSDRLLTIRYDMPNALNVGGEALVQEFSPRLLTYQINQDGHWELIASAVHGHTAKAADGIKCISQATK